MHNLKKILNRYRAQALHDLPFQPSLPGEELDDGEQVQEGRSPLPSGALAYEQPFAHWQPRPVMVTDSWVGPCRFIDGRLDSRTVACLLDKNDRRRPLILAHIGAVALRLVQGRLVREAERLETIAVLITNGFYTEDIRALAGELEALGIRLVPHEVRHLSGDFEECRRRTFDFAVQEMQGLERELLCLEPSTATIIDGLIEQRSEGVSQAQYLPVTGVVKRLLRRYLPLAGLEVIYNLPPSYRTPAFHLMTKKADLVSWYLRLSGERGAVPTWGVVRVEVPLRYFETKLARDFTHLDRLSGWLYRLRCRDLSYPRSAVSIEPIVYAEAQLRALLPPIAPLVARFHYAGGLV